MEANNHFNYGTHPAASANSGLKRSSGDSLYTNGSSMSFPQQGKNMNGEMNVNGVTTVLGSGVPGSHPPTTPYPHMSNHQSSMGYDYLWGGQAQYSSAMGPSPGHGMHQKQPPSGMMQPQSQHHYQGHGQYQLNGGMGSSHQPPVAGPPNMSSPGGQYWNRSNPGPQQMSFNSPNVYGSYQSHVHPGISSSQHHQQQQQQTLQPPAHQPSQQHLHSHHHPQHHHQQQQSQHYGMMPNGMPYYQPHHPTLPSPQPQPTTPSQPQSQAPMIPPAPQNFTPPRGSPQHHNIGRGGTSSPLPVSSVSMLSPSSAQDSGSPQGQSRERSPHPATAGMPAVMQGNMSDAYQDADAGYNVMEKATGGQKLPKSDGFQTKPPLPHEYSQHAEQSAAQCPDMASSMREPAVNASPRSMSSHPSGSPAAVSTSPLGKGSTPPRLSVAPVASSMPVPGPPTDPSNAAVSTPPRIATPPSLASLQSVSKLSSPPLMVHGLRPPPGSASHVDSAGSPHRTMGSPSRVSASPSKLPAMPPLLDNVPRPPVSSAPLVTAPSLVSEARKMLFPRMTSSPYTTSHATTTALAPSYSGSAPISALQQMVDGSRSPPVTSRFPDSSRAPPEKSQVSGPLTTNSSSSAPPKPCSSVSTPPRLVPSFPSDNKSVPTLQLQTLSPTTQSAHTTAPAATLSPAPVDMELLASSVQGPASQPLYSLPPSTTQASRTTFGSAPPALVSSTSAVAASPLAHASAVTKPSCINIPSRHAPKPPPPAVEEEDGASGDGIGPALTPICVGEECPPSQPHTSETDLRQHPKSRPPAEKAPQAPVSSNGTVCRPARGASEDGARGPASVPRARSPQRHGAAAGDLSAAEEGSFNDWSGDDASRSEGDSMLHGTSRGDVSSSGMEDASHMDGDSSHVNESTRMDDSSLVAEDASALDGTSRAEDEPSGVADATRESLGASLTEEEELDESRAGETSRAEETMDSCVSARDATLESSLNSTSQMEESSVYSSQIDASVTDSFGPFHASTQESEDEAARACDLPDSAGPIGNKATVSEAAPGPVFKIMEEEITALMETPTTPRVPPITIKTSPASGRPVKTPGKPRKPRAPKASTPVATPAEKAPRKPRARTPKVEKIKKPKGEEATAATAKADEGAKAKGAGRKRKKPLKEEEVKDTSGVSEAAGPPAAEMDPISAIIEAVLARASEASSPDDDNPKKPKKAKKQGQEGGGAKAPKLQSETAEEEAENDADDSSTAGESNRRRVATEEQVQFPLLHGWRREIRVKKTESRMKGETWYYTPCGRRMKQFPEIIKYLKRHQDSVVTREHFSFSPRMPIGDFYEERETPEGKAWVLLANEEVPSIIMAITGRRGRPPNPDKEKPRRVRAPKGGQVRRPGRPPKPKMVDLLSKVDAKLLKRLEAKEALTEEDKEKIAKIKKKMKRKARMKRKEDAKNKKIREDKKKAKLEKDQAVNDQAVAAEPAPEAAPPADSSQAPESMQETKKPRRKRTKAVAPAPVQQSDEERIAQGKRVLGARSKAKALAKAQAEAEAVAQAALTAKRAAERRAQAQRRLEERKRQQMISEELKKPTEDMCLTDHKPLPELSRIPGVVLSGAAFAHCLTVVEFLHGYGKVIGLNIPKDIPSLATLQEGLLGLGEGQGEVQDLLLKLLEAALHDPGLSSYYQSVKILGEKLVDLELTRSTVSEPLRLFLESHGYDVEVCDALRTKTFHALPPDTKASILGFLAEELNGSNIVISDIDNTLENMATYRKNKWIIEGKLRKLKAALARRTGRSEEELCLEERRRSSRVAEEEGLEEGGLLQDRASRRGRKEEPKLSDSESPTNASIPELERQIDKLTKRQQLFRKKLLQSSHSMRAVSLGQDRFRRRYLALPHLGAILVEGPEELLSSEEVLVSEVPVTLLKREPKVEEPVTPTSPPASPPPTAATPTPTPTTPTAAGKPPASSPDEHGDGDDGLPGTASLMSQPRGRGRPRKIKPEVELHLRTAKIRRRRRSSARSGGEEGPGSPRDGPHGAAPHQSWLSQTQEPATGGAPGGRRPEEGVKETAEKRGQWFNLLPKEPCDSSSLAEPQGPASPGTPRVPLGALPAALAASLLQAESALPGQCPAVPVTTPPQDGATAPLSPSAAAPAATPPALPCSPAPDPGPAAAPAAPPATSPRPVRRRRRGSRGSSPARRGARNAAAKRRGRPPNAVFQELEQQYFTQMVVKPIPTSMVRGWWWIQDAEELQATLHALNPRGIREKVLHKHLAKHMESLGQMCTKPVADPIFHVKMEEDEALLEALHQPWQVQERVLEVDINALQWVEELEQRVITADLHLKVAPQCVGKTESTELDPDVPVAEFQPYAAPEPDSTRDDLRYYEHEADPRDDWTVRTKREWSDVPRVATHALDLAVLRLANLERNIERRYLKEPLWNAAEVMRLAPVTTTPGEAPPMDVMSLESEITPRLRTWRQALDRCRSAPQLCLCILQLEKAVAWERSVVKLNCQVCRKGDNDEYLLLCDGCDCGCHMYCLRPKVTQVPEGDWFCPTCTAKEGDSPGGQRSAKKRTRLKKRRYEDDSSDEETAPRRMVGMATRHKDTPPPPLAPSSSSSSSSASRYCGDGGGGGGGGATGISPAKRRRMTTRNQPDLTYCEIILMEMEAHAHAWPFLEPVNPRLVPGYRRIVKNPMDFLTMRERLLQGGYCNCEEFAADAQLVFNNCELFNEDTSEVGVAGHAMRRFFENRWAEFYENKDK